MKSPQTAQCPRTLLWLLFWLSKQRRLENICSRQVTFQQFLPPEESRWICLVHQFDDLLLVRGVQRSHRNVPHSSELAAVVQMFILQPKRLCWAPVTCITHHIIIIYLKKFQINLLTTSSMAKTEVVSSEYWLYPVSLSISETVQLNLSTRSSTMAE